MESAEVTAAEGTPWIFCMGVARYDPTDPLVGAACWAYPGDEIDTVLEPGWTGTYRVMYQYCCESGSTQTIKVEGPCGTIYEAGNGGYLQTFYPGQHGRAWYAKVPDDACLGRYSFTVSITDSGSKQTTTGTIYFHVGYKPPPAVDSAQTFGSCGEGDLAANPSGCQSDPVNSATGSFITRGTDAALPSLGVPFEFTRTYNSADDRVGLLGKGWSHSFGSSLAVQANGDVIVRGEDGQRVYFVKGWDGSFFARTGERAKLQKVADGYLLKTQRGARHYGFDDTGRLTSAKDSRGQGVTLSYGAGSNPTSIIDSAGRSVDLTYNLEGQLSGLQLPGGRSVAYGYTDGLLTTVTDLRGNTVGYTYDTGGRLVDVVDQNGNLQVHNVYGTDGRVVEQTDAKGQVSTFSWDQATQTSTMTDARGNAWKDVYDDNVLVKRIDPLGNAYQYLYDQRLDLRRIVDPRGKPVSMTYDSRHNMVTRSVPSLAITESFTYNSDNKLTSHKDGRGNTTSFGYDAHGDLTNVTRPGFVATTITRDPTTGLGTAMTDERGKVTSFEYDAQGNVATVISPLGHRQTMEYDPHGRLIGVVDPRGNATGAAPADFKTLFGHNPAGQIVEITDPLGHAATNTYDPAGNLISRTDAKSRTTTYQYDAANRLIKVIAPNNTSTSYGYDPAGNLTSRTDSKDHTTTYEYDAANRLIGVVGPTGARWSYERDASGNVLEVIDPNGNATATSGDGVTTYAYDALDRMTAVDYSDSTPDVTYAYDANSNRTQMTDGSGTETYAYDALNRVTSVTRVRDTIAYAYDPAGNRTSVTYPDGTTVDYTYDDDGHLATIAADGVVTSHSYDPAGRLLATTLPSDNGHTETRSYDRAGRLVEVSNQKGADVLSRVSYVLDEVGNPTQMSTSSGVSTLAYDSMDRLTEVCFQQSCPGLLDPFIRYEYDAVGNRVTESRPTGSTTYSHDAADRLTSRVEQSGADTYTHDANGNLTQEGATTLTYDLANRLKSHSASGATTTYSYDGAGKRLLAVRGNTKTSYLWDPASGIADLLSDKEGNTLRRYVHGNGLLSMLVGRAAYYYHRDGLGSVTNVTSSTGAPQWTYAYEPFGVTRSEVKHNTKAPGNPMKFTSQLIDPTGLYHLRARQYDPTTGRFAQADPLSSAAWAPHVSSYAYVANRPTRFTDPAGLCAILPNPTTGDYLMGAACPPEDFEQVMGYTPVLVSTPNGLRVKRPTWENGGCSSVADTSWSYDFQLACRAHDYAYDLVRYGAPGADVGGADNFLFEDMHLDCDSRNFFQRLSCRGNANLIWSFLRGWDHVGFSPNYGQAQ